VTIEGFDGKKIEKEIDATGKLLKTKEFVKDMFGNDKTTEIDADGTKKEILTKKDGSFYEKKIFEDGTVEEKNQKCATCVAEVRKEKKNADGSKTATITNDKGEEIEETITKDANGNEVFVSKNKKTGEQTIKKIYFNTDGTITTAITDATGKTKATRSTLDGSKSFEEDNFKAVGEVPVNPLCTSYFDGCNTCTVKESIKGACTKKACRASSSVTKEKAKCLKC